jgi:hypothetical protein
MKKIILMLCLSVSAMAFEKVLPIRETGGILPIEQGFTCFDQHMADAGYHVAVSPDHKTATLTESTFIGSNLLAELECFRVASSEPTMPDQMSVVLTCVEPSLRDAGYSVDISQGGIAGLTTATISSISFVGSKFEAEVPCRP